MKRCREPPKPSDFSSSRGVSPPTSDECGVCKPDQASAMLSAPVEQANLIENPCDSLIPKVLTPGLRE